MRVIKAITVNKYVKVDGRQQTMMVLSEDPNNHEIITEQGKIIYEEQNMLKNIYKKQK